MTNGRLCPTLALDWDAGGGTEVLLELVGVVGLRMGGRAGERDASLAPCLSGVLILSRAELTSCLRLLLERLLLLGVGISDLDLHFLAARLERVVVEIPDDIFAGLARLEANYVVSNDDHQGGEGSLTEQSQHHGHGRSCPSGCVKSTPYVAGTDSEAHARSSTLGDWTRRDWCCARPRRS